jgi:surface protein
MIYINNNKLNRGYINNYNKAYINGKVMYWNQEIIINEDDYNLILEYDMEQFPDGVTYMINNVTYTATTSPYRTNYNETVEVFSFNGSGVRRINKFPSIAAVDSLSIQPFGRSCIDYLDVRDWDFSGLMNNEYNSTFCYLFMYTQNAEYIYYPSDIFDNVKSLNGVFGGCSKLKTQTLNTANAELLSYAFYEDSSLVDVTLTSFNNCTTMANMFNGCSSLSVINVDSWNTPNLTDTSNMFRNCSSLVTLDLIDFNVSNITSYDGMFEGCSSLTEIYCYNQETYDFLQNAVNAAGLSNCTVYCDVCSGGDEPDEPSGDQYVRVDLNGEWEMSSENVFDAEYTSYNSFSNKGVGNSTATMRLYIKGYNNYTFKYMSDAEGGWDYMILMPADVNWNGSDGLYNTRNKQQQVLDATYTFDDPTIEHFIEIVYKKDSSVDKNKDCGFIGIMQEVLAEEWRMSETEFIKDGDTYYTKDYKWITFDNTYWIQTNEYRTGYQIVTGSTTVDGYFCINGNKYAKEEIIFYDHPNITYSGEYITGGLIEENAEDCQFVSDFMFNYNFDDFNENTYVIPNHPSASFQQDLQLQGSLVYNNDGEHSYGTITNSSAYGVFNFGSEQDNPFNSSNNEAMTFIFKVKGGNRGTDLISCRGNSSWNWMVRPYKNYATLHTGNGECADIGYDNPDVPNVIAITFDGTKVKYYNLTDGTSNECSDGRWGGNSELLVFFASMYSGVNNGITEEWDGNCYWMFCAKRLLDENEINSVAYFNGF